MKRSVAVATIVSAALLASSTAFAVANGVLGGRQAHRVGTFQPAELRLVPADSPTTARSPRRSPGGEDHTSVVPGGAGRTTPSDGTPRRTGDLSGTADTNTSEPPEASSPRVAPTKAPTTHSTVSPIPSGRAGDDHGDDNGAGGDD